MGRNATNSHTKHEHLEVSHFARHGKGWEASLQQVWKCFVHRGGWWFSVKPKLPNTNKSGTQCCLEAWCANKSWQMSSPNLINPKSAQELPRLFRLGFCCLNSQYWSVAMAAQPPKTHSDRLHFKRISLCLHLQCIDCFQMMNQLM
jgi:hypothetical protein